MSGDLINKADRDELLRRALRFGAAEALLDDELAARRKNSVDEWDDRQHVAWDAKREAESKLHAWALSLYAQSLPAKPAEPAVAELSAQPAADEPVPF